MVFLVLPNLTYSLMSTCHGITSWPSQNGSRARNHLLFALSEARSTWHPNDVAEFLYNLVWVELELLLIMKRWVVKQLPAQFIVVMTMSSDCCDKFYPSNLWRDIKGDRWITLVTVFIKKAASEKTSNLNGDKFFLNLIPWIKWYACKTICNSNGKSHKNEATVPTRTHTKAGKTTTTACVKSSSLDSL